jgi:hypothetical protein
MEERFTGLFTTMGEVSGGVGVGLLWGVSARSCTAQGLFSTVMAGCQPEQLHIFGVPARKSTGRKSTGCPVPCPAARFTAQVLQRLNEHLDGTAPLGGAEYEQLVGRLEASMAAASSYVR